MGVTAVDMPLVKIGKAAELLSVSVQTLRKWDSGELVPDRRSEGGVRYYDMGKILGLGSEDMPTIGYARVSSHDQKNDLVRQQELLEAFCQPKAGVMRSSPISARDLTTKRKAYSDYWN
jgi:predicted site-specific integrase-resolvase